MGYLPEHVESSVDLDITASRKHAWASGQWLSMSYSALWGFTVTMRF